MMSDERDCIRRFSFTGLPIRGQWVRLGGVLEEALGVDRYPAPIRTLLAKMLAAVAMLADNIKFKGAVSLQSKGDGSLLRSLAECRAQTHLRAIAHLVDDWQADAPAAAAEHDLRAWLGAGQLAFTLLPDDTNQQPYQGLIELSEPSLEQNLAKYFAVSEQLPTWIFLALSPEAVTGLCLQRLPSRDLATEIELQAHEEAWQTLRLLAETVDAAEMHQHDAAGLLSKLFAEYPCRLFPARVLDFQCTCTRRKTDQTLELLPATEINELLAERGSIDVDCEFCGQRYSYDAIDIQSLRNNTHSRPDTTLH